MHFNKSTEGFDVFADGPSGAGIGGDWGADGNAAIFGDFGCNIANAADVEIAMLLAEPQF